MATYSLQVPAGQYQLQEQHHQAQYGEVLALLQSRRLEAFPG